MVVVIIKMKKVIASALVLTLSGCASYMPISQEVDITDFFPDERSGGLNKSFFDPYHAQNARLAAGSIYGILEECHVTAERDYPDTIIGNFKGAQGVFYRHLEQNDDYIFADPIKGDHHEVNAAYYKINAYIQYAHNPKKRGDIPFDPCPRLKEIYPLEYELAFDVVPRLREAFPDRVVEFPSREQLIADKKDADRKAEEKRQAEIEQRKQQRLERERKREEEKRQREIEAERKRQVIAKETMNRLAENKAIMRFVLQDGSCGSNVRFFGVNNTNHSKQLFAAISRTYSEKYTKPEFKTISNKYHQSFNQLDSVDVTRFCYSNKSRVEDTIRALGNGMLGTGLPY
ncbi:hypothetical protein AB4140_14155 [Shewanella sp. 10N.286.51.B2]|uniref:hypothetical protein n=1 Tax=Shewanella sp. 10N.286.51.B2 TaxID=3229707 RepID=UPI003553C80E